MKLLHLKTIRSVAMALASAICLHGAITRGSGNFHLEKTVADDGWMHVSFYVNGPSHGGIYFGEKGFENTVLRKKGWSDFPAASTEEAHGTPSGSRDDDRKNASNRQNRSIMEYLGDPVRPPATLNESYFPTNLLAAFIALSKKRGLQIKKLEVDDSEFPFLVYGVVAGKTDFGWLVPDLREMKGYAYGGSVVGSADEGGTYFSLNVIPHDQYPPGQFAACNRRLMVRLQMLADTIRQAK